MRQKKTSSCDPLYSVQFLQCSLTYFTGKKSSKAGLWLMENSTRGMAPSPNVGQRLQG